MYLHIYICIYIYICQYVYMRADSCSHPDLPRLGLGEDAESESKLVELVADTMVTLGGPAGLSFKGRVE